MPKRLGLSPSLTRSPAELTRLGLPPQSSHGCSPGHCPLPGPSEWCTLPGLRSSCGPGGLAPPRDIPPWRLRGARALQTCINKALIPTPAPPLTPVLIASGRSTVSRMRPREPPGHGQPRCHTGGSPNLFQM